MCIETYQKFVNADKWLEAQNAQLEGTAVSEMRILAASNMLFIKRNDGAPGELLLQTYTDEASVELVLYKSLFLADLYKKSTDMIDASCLLHEGVMLFVIFFKPETQPFSPEKFVELSLKDRFHAYYVLLEQIVSALSQNMCYFYLGVESLKVGPRGYTFPVIFESQGIEKAGYNVEFTKSENAPVFIKRRVKSTNIRRQRSLFIRPVKKQSKGRWSICLLVSLLFKLESKYHKTHAAQGAELINQNITYQKFMLYLQETIATCTNSKVRVRDSVTALEEMITKIMKPSETG